jgi:hypothetical protein
MSFFTQNQYSGNSEREQRKGEREWDGERVENMVKKVPGVNVIKRFTSNLQIFVIR